MCSRAHPVVFLLVSFALANAVARGQEVKLADLVAEALERSPEILAAQKKYEAAKQRPSQAGSLPDPTLSMGWNSNGNPLPGAGLGTDATSNIGVSVTQEIPAPGKQRLRSNIAEKEAAAQFQELQSVELSVISRVKQAFFKLQHSDVARDVLERDRDVLKKLLAITEIRYSAGQAAQQDVFKAQIQISLLEAKILLLDRDRRLRGAELNSLLNRPTEAPLDKPGEPHVAPLTKTLAEVQAALGSDRAYEFIALPPGFADKVYGVWRDRLDRRFIADLPDKQVRAQWEVRAKLLGTIQGSQGVIRVGENRIVYETDKPGQSRTWRLEDINNIASAGPFDLSVVTSEHSGAFNSGSREFRFQLKQPLPEARYNDLWRRLNSSKESEFVRTSSKTEEQHHE
ncbi:MAG: TolC family protein [Bryobacteraceae bacterium]